MNIKKYKRLESDLAMAKIDLEKRFIDLVNEEFGVQFDAIMSSSYLELRLSGKNYPHATYDFNKKESFRNEYLTLDEVARFIKVVLKLEEVL